MIELFDNKRECCGCTACVSICPQDAIEMFDDAEGFKYPLIDNEKCILCGLCKKVCAFQNGYDVSNSYDTPLVYAVKHRNDNVRMGSTSGGAFTAISDDILDNNGIVYGVKLDKDMNVIHSRAETERERDKFKGSKYVQSDLSCIFTQVENDLLEQKRILFTGTPCQCAGLLSFLNLRKIDQEKLIVCDIVCHGTPSPLLWREHIASLENKYQSKIIDYHFRSKIKGWHAHNELSMYENGRVEYKSSFLQKNKILFQSDIILRPSCHNCKYTNLQRCSDMTIADFWGVEKTMPEIDDNKGISLLLVNTPKGNNLFDRINACIDYKESNVSNCLQPQLQYPSKPSPKREQFWTDFHDKGYQYVIRKYAGVGIKAAIRRCVVKSLQKLRLMAIAKRILAR